MPRPTSRKYNVEIEDEAMLVLSAIEKELPHYLAEELLDAIDALEYTPRPPKALEQSSPPVLYQLYELTVVGWCIDYRIIDEERRVVVINIEEGEE